MKACGLVVEYNPLHNGHLYHINRAKKKSNAHCIIAIMSGSFLQRGEPAIIDKFHRTKVALQSGVDIVLELPYVYAVQNSDLFAKGAIHSLHAIGVSDICFGSESGDIDEFISSYHIFSQKKTAFEQALQKFLQKGLSFPRASKKAFSQVGLTEQLNLAKPNNILGFSYVKTILENNIDIQPLTIKRIDADYHDENIVGTITSATSIRYELFKNNLLTSHIKNTMPAETKKALINYKRLTDVWHQWENYFPFLKYRVSTMSPNQLANIHDVQEGLQYRIIETEKEATSFEHWMKLLKTKRYTWTRLQRIFTHILTNTTKEEIKSIHDQSIPYIRMLGFTKTGQKYLGQIKSDMDIPIITHFSREQPYMLSLEEKASKAYYSILKPKLKKQLLNQERERPITV